MFWRFTRPLTFITLHLHLLSLPLHLDTSHHFPRPIA
jgi:hypothetical protein